MYDKKNESYFSNVRTDIFSLLPDKISRVLEVGCGTGETLHFIKTHFKNVTTVGIELTDNAAKAATEKVDIVKNIDIEDIKALEGLGKFDLILLLDVLEHLRDPWEALKNLSKNNLLNQGCVITSIPNARNYSLLFNLMCGEFKYLDAGVLDKTHLRFFTKKSMIRLIDDADLKIVKCLPTNLDGNSRSAHMNRITLGLFEELFAVQYIIKSIKI